jgi:adenylate cyclase
VRQAGTRIRIAAQLIRADNGLQIWSENYDRDLTDVFAVQEDIARAITTSLRMPLGLKPGENLVNNRGIDPESYQQFLRAKALLRARSLNEAIAVLEPLVAHEPSYAPAWAILANCYGLWPAYNQVSVRSGSPEQERQAFLTYDDKVEKAAREAIRLDPRNAAGYAALAAPEGRRTGRAKSDELYQQALALDPGDADILDGCSQGLAAAGRLKEAIRLREQLRTLEPFVPIYNVVTADYFRLVGQNDTAIQMLKAVTPDEPQVTFARDWSLAQVYAVTGRYSEAADTLLAIPENQNRVARRSVEDAARLLRTAPPKVSAPDRLPAFIDELSFVYTYVGAPDRVLEGPERSAALGFLGAVRQLWAPQNALVRKTDDSRR